MALQFPNVNGKTCDFSKVEIDLGGKIFVAVDSISYKQPLEEGELRGTASEPLGRTRGRLKMGDGSIKFSDIATAQEFLDTLGDGYLEKTWDVSVTFTIDGGSSLKHQLFSCRLLDVEDDHSGGNDPLMESMPFSFLRMERNGKTALLNQRR